VAALWGVKNRVGEILQDFTAASRIEVGLKVVSTRYDAFRLQVSSSYRQLFNRALSQILDKKHWRIVRVRRPPAAEIISEPRRSRLSAIQKEKDASRGTQGARGQPTWTPPRGKSGGPEQARLLSSGSRRRKLLHLGL
jgi:hypothetical protein